MMDIVLRLREARRMRGLSQKETAQLSGVGVKTISSYETGARIGSIKYADVRELLRVYELSESEFFSASFECSAIEASIQPDRRLHDLVCGIEALDDERRQRLLNSFSEMLRVTKQSAQRGQRLW